VKHLRVALVRALVFLLVIGGPTVVFDVVYWETPLPAALLMPVEVAFRLTVTCFFTALLESALPRGWLWLLSFGVAFVIYALGYCETEYVNGVFTEHALAGGIAHVSDLVHDAGLHPGSYVLLLTIVSVPFAAAPLARTLNRDVLPVTFVTFLVTFVVVASLLEPYRLEVGRVRAAFVCIRTVFCALLLPFVAWLGDRLEVRLARAMDAQA
jgi:hypothetical protein